MGRAMRLLPSVILVGSALIGVPAGARPGDHPERIHPAAPPELNAVSEDPYTNPGTYHRTQVEPHSYAFGSTIVSIFQSGRSYNWGSSNIGWSVSTDAGKTWNDGFLPGTTTHATPAGRWQRVTDAVVAYDAKHDTWLIVGLGTRPCSFPPNTCPGAQVFVSRSNDGAMTFEKPFVPVPSTRSRFFDQPWIMCDNFPVSPFYGNCYTVWNDDWHHGLLHAFTSSDGGRTWTPATFAADHHCVGGPTLVVQSKGTVVIAFTEGCDTYKKFSFVSTDGGASYHGPFGLLSFDARAPAHIRAGPGPTRLDVDAAGMIYATWMDCGFRFIQERQCTHNDIVLSTSHDGREWTDMVRIPIDPVTSSADHFLPAIAVDPNTSGASAHIAVVFYFHPEQWCDATTCQLHVGLVSSTDGGSTWTFQQVAGPFRNTWFPRTNSGYMVGEYIAISFVDGQAVAVFPVATSATKGRCHLGDIASCNVWTASATIPLSGP